MLPCTKNCIAKSARFLLPDKMDICKIRKFLTLGKKSKIAAAAQMLIEFCGNIKMILNRTFIPTGNNQDIITAGSNSLLHHILDNRFVNDRHHLFRLRLGYRKKTRAPAGCRDHRFFNTTHQQIPSASSIVRI